ncbi:hypothetical protein MLD38_039321 [Melastoma candidum]|uniref:Uncharacterized protein n=1 Tax=Melastoma candidum TaxID=119954 RepID=A0ACB9L2F4_9MYRT|nr:hypothetical protein MLD38_039321 [Melastoma candidum]
MEQPTMEEFKTPRLPSQGTNRWGGASPLLARHVPQESLDQVYQRVTAVHAHDEVYMCGTKEGYLESRRRLFDPMLEEDEKEVVNQEAQSCVGIKGFLRGLMRMASRRKGRAYRVVRLGWRSRRLRMRRRWWRRLPRFKFERWDYRNRWPQGWC